MKFVRALFAVFAIAFAPSAFAAGDLTVVNVPATIASGASVSGNIDLGPGRLYAVTVPASWTTANLSFQASSDGVNYSNLYDDTGSEVIVTASAGQYIVMSSPAKWLGIRWIRVRSGTSGTPVTQGADRSLVVIAVP